MNINTRVKTILINSTTTSTNNRARINTVMDNNIPINKVIVSKTQANRIMVNNTTTNPMAVNKTMANTITGDKIPTNTITANKTMARMVITSETSSDVTVINLIKDMEIQTQKTMRVTQMIKEKTTTNTPMQGSPMTPTPPTGKALTT